MFLPPEVKTIKCLYGGTKIKDLKTPRRVPPRYHGLNRIPREHLGARIDHKPTYNKGFRILKVIIGI